MCNKERCFETIEECKKALAAARRERSRGNMKWKANGYYWCQEHLALHLTSSRNYK